MLVGSGIGIGFYKKILFELFSYLEKCVLINIGNLKPFSNVYGNRSSSLQV